MSEQQIDIGKLVKKVTIRYDFLNGSHEEIGFSDIMQFIPAPAGIVSSALPVGVEMRNMVLEPIPTSLQIIREELQAVEKVLTNLESLKGKVVQQVMVQRGGPAGTPR